MGRELPYFVVINEQGPARDEKRSTRDQKGWTEHAAFMDALADEHFVIMGGPFIHSKHRRMHVLGAPNDGHPKDIRWRPYAALHSARLACSVALDSSPW